MHLQVLLDEGGKVGVGAALKLDGGGLEFVAQMGSTDQDNSIAARDRSKHEQFFLKLLILIQKQSWKYIKTKENS